MVELFDTRTSRVVATSEVPFRIDACSEPQSGRMVLCEHGRYEEDELACRAMVPEGFAARRFTWRLTGRGLGSTDAPPPVETPKSEALLTVPPRVETGALTSYVVEATATDTRGGVRKGRVSVTVPNLYWEASAWGAGRAL